MKKFILDNAATLRLGPEVLSFRMQDCFWKVPYGNPSSSHGFGRTAKTAIEKARKTLPSIKCPFRLR